MSKREINPETTMKAEPPQLESGRALTLLFRGARLRCPHCGGGPLFTRWLIMRESCPGCHLILDRGEVDYFLGGYTVNFIVAELLIVLGGAAAIVFTWPEVPWTLGGGRALAGSLTLALFFMGATAGVAGLSWRLGRPQKTGGTP